MDSRERVVVEKTAQSKRERERERERERDEVYSTGRSTTVISSGSIVSHIYLSVYFEWLLLSFKWLWYTKKEVNEMLFALCFPWKISCATSIMFLSHSVSKRWHWMNGSVTLSVLTGKNCPMYSSVLNSDTSVVYNIPNLAMFENTNCSQLML